MTHKKSIIEQVMKKLPMVKASDIIKQFETNLDKQGVKYISRLGTSKEDLFLMQIKYLYSAIQKTLKELKKKRICFECHSYPCDVMCPMQGKQDSLFVSDVEKYFEVKDAKTK